MIKGINNTKNLEQDILQLELKIIEMSKRATYFKQEIPSAKIRLKAMRRNLELSKK